MNGWLRWFAVVIFPIAVSVAHASQEATVPVDMIPVQVSAHAWYVPGDTGVATDNYGFVSNSAFVVGSDGVIVFDTLGTPALGTKLLAAIRTVTSAPIKRIYISHYHADHMYGNQAFADTGAEIVASDGAKRYLEGEIAQQRLNERRVSLGPWVNDATRIVSPDRYLRGEERFEFGDVTIRVVDVGSAHSEGDLVLFVEDDGVLFSGDIIFEGRIPFLGTSSSAAWLDVLDEMEKAEVGVIVPGHGKAAENPREVVSLTRNYLAFVRASMRQAVDNWIPFDEAYEATDWGDFIEYPAFTEANRRNAYGIYLSLEQESLQSQ
ncbi:MAG: MBL fold metallo-hydrolase [Gammaproteobacteria bacterium]|nr:MBL fold metallo-hydrolase [Gammaproteobacteria bacterium]MDH3449791.1 MBL fold metallo-hydrolase [Gammaproteobacteria bacterium]